MTLYDKLQAAGIETDSHESDLYVKDSATAREIIRASRLSFSLFRSARDGTHWLDVPFAYAPFWRTRCGGRAA